MGGLSTNRLIDTPPSQDYKWYELPFGAWISFDLEYHAWVDDSNTIMPWSHYRTENKMGYGYTPTSTYNNTKTASFSFRVGEGFFRQYRLRPLYTSSQMIGVMGGW